MQILSFICFNLLSCVCVSYLSEWVSDMCDGWIWKFNFEYNKGVFMWDKGNFLNKNIVLKDSPGEINLWIWIQDSDKINNKKGVSCHQWDVEYKITQPGEI